MYLSRKAFLSLRTSLLNEYKISEKDYAKLLEHLTISSLLHDIGHAPFSHLGEVYYKQSEIKEELVKLIEERKLNIDPQIFKKGSKHEQMSCYIIIKTYHDLINEFDLELLCRCIVGCIYESTSKWLENIVISILNSSTIDTDKLDYLMRDAYMTGVTVPAIDTTRLFKNIMVNPATKKITYLDKALPVIQNIIDARDSLYLWVYNHHTVVYTDFLVEFYIKHLGVNWEKSQYLDRLNPYDFFSCKAISNYLVSDPDLQSILKSPLKKMMETGSSEPIDITPESTSTYVSNYTKRIFPQLFARDFLKPLWKTIYEYTKFLEENIRDESVIEELISKMCDKNYAYRRHVVKRIIEECKLNHGEIFIIPRSNKFYSLNSATTFKVYLEGRDIEISKLLPQRDFGELYNNVSFYVFCKEEKLLDVKEAFIKIVLEGLPFESEIPKDSTILNWLIS